MIEESKNPFFSVVIPAYNRPIFIKQALLSVLNQNFTDFEIIVTDDSSDTLVQKVVDSINVDKIRYFRNKPALKTAMNVRKGIQLAEGNFIAILNDDDFWGSEWLNSVFEVLKENPETDLIFCDHWIVDRFGVVDISLTEINSKFYKRDVINSKIPPHETPQLFVDNVIPIAMASVFRKVIIDLDDFPLEIGGAYDRWIMLNIIISSKSSIIYIPNRLTYYRVHDGSLSINKSEYSTNWVAFVLKKALQTQDIFTNVQKNKIILDLKKGHKYGFYRSVLNFKILDGLRHFLLFFKYFFQSFFSKSHLIS